MSRITDADRVSAWVNGDPVTNRINGDVGSVKWTNSRHSDGKRFVRVRVQGREVWENGNWVIGTGAHQRTCYECGYAYRTDDQQATFCLCCARHHRPSFEADATSATHHRLQIRGNATRTRPPEPVSVTAAKKDDDDSEGPF